MWWQRLLIAGASALLVGFIVGFAYLATTGMFNPLDQKITVAKLWAAEEEKNMVVNENTIMSTKNIYLCGHAEEISEKSSAYALVGIDYAELHRMFSTQDGWHVQFDSPEELILGRRVEELCLEHQDYRHLGIYHGNLAIFQGPLGVNTLLLQVIQRPVENLPTNLRSKLDQAKEFETLELEIQEKLKQELEFRNDKELNAALENLDELN